MLSANQTAKLNKLKNAPTPILPKPNAKPLAKLRPEVKAKRQGLVQARPQK